MAGTTTTPMTVQTSPWGGLSVKSATAMSGRGARIQSAIATRRARVHPRLFRPASASAQRVASGLTEMRSSVMRLWGAVSREAVTSSITPIATNTSSARIPVNTPTAVVLGQEPGRHSATTGFLGSGLGHATALPSKVC